MINLLSKIKAGTKPRREKFGGFLSCYIFMGCNVILLTVYGNTVVSVNYRGKTGAKNGAFVYQDWLKR